MKTPLEEEEFTTDLAELFDRDPLNLTDADFDRIITEMMKAREKWMHEKLRASREGRKPRLSEGAKKPRGKSKLSLEDLDL